LPEVARVANAPGCCGAARGSMTINAICPRRTATTTTLVIVTTTSDSGWCVWVCLLWRC